LPKSSFPRSLPGPALEPAHQHTISDAGDGTGVKVGSCRCGKWTARAKTSDQLAEAFRMHLESAQGTLL
jgi:hypothetical protein